VGSGTDDHIVNFTPFADMVLKFYASYLGGGSAVVALVLAEKQIPFEYVAVDVAAQQHKTAEYLAMHPFGQVPLIVRSFR
jgi:glutathione S-transferase